MNEVTIVGGGLAGSEAAWQLADRGVPVHLYEMRPETLTGAHRSGNLGEVVCSNSFKSTLAATASGLLKAEMDTLGCRLLDVARQCAVPAGHALGIDREMFSQAVTTSIESHPLITVSRECVENLDLTLPAVIATGPLTDDKLSRALQEHCSSEHMYFYDAIAPSLDGDSIDQGVGFWASRYGKGSPDYLNIPLDQEAYRSLIENIREAERAAAHHFEDAKYFEACLPVEVIVGRGDDTLRHGPLKPKGLVDPKTGQEPYAVLQLRQETRGGGLLGMVGFQTRMTQACQKKMIRSIPGLENVGILRYGSIHRNLYLNVPEICDRFLADRKRPGLFYAGQICGVEGYVESIASAMVVALSVYADRQGRPFSAIPRVTMIGAIMDYVHTPNPGFQPMNANMGLLPFEGRRRGNRRARNQAMTRTAVAAMEAYRSANSWLF